MVKQRVSTEESVLLMSPQVMYGRPGPRLECIHRGEVQGILTEYSSSAWQIGDVVGYAPMEKLRKPSMRRVSSLIGAASPGTCWVRCCGWCSGQLSLSRR